MNYKLAFALGTIPPGTVGREPVAWLYNGVKLPKLPEWDKTAYPYAYIVDLSVLIGTSENTIKLYLCDTPWYADLSTVFCKVTADCTEIRYDINGDSWEYAATNSRSAGTSVANRNTLVWCSADIPKLSDGSVWLKATEPVPVYE